MAVTESLGRIQDDLNGTFEGELFTSALRRALYATDGSLYQITAAAVACPRHLDDVITLVRYARENRIPLIARGAGTGLAGESLGRGIVVDFSRHLRRVISVSGDRVRVMPGVVCDRLNHLLRPYGRTLPLDPAGSSVTTVGSMVAIDAAGSRSLRYGTTRDYVERLQVVLASGDVIEAGRESLDRADRELPAKRRLIGELAGLLGRNRELIQRKWPRSRRNRAGYLVAGALENGTLDLARLLVGSEGTLALFTEITLRTCPLPRFRGATLLLFGRLGDAARAVLEVLPFGPSACDLLDRRLLSLARDADADFARLIPAGAEAALVVEQEGNDAIEVRDRLRAIVDHVRRKKRLAFDSREAFEPKQIERLWRLPRTVVPLLYRMKGSARPVPFVEDMAVPPDVLPSFLVRVQNVLKRHQVTASLFAHAGDGQLHWRPFLNPADPHDRRRMERLARELYEAVLEVGGTISGEHGDGLVRTPFLRRQYGELYAVFGQVKRLFDPGGLLNPGKIVADQPAPLLSHLRPSAGEPRSSPPFRLALAWSAEQLCETAGRCNGCGACRTQEIPQRMCPIFRADPAEEASPRAKANLMRHLFEGSLGRSIVADPDFKRLADLCVNCKMCRLECPAGVDIPNLMIEAKGAHVSRRGLRWSDWALSRADRIAALGCLSSRISNWLLAQPTWRWALERVLGISRHRRLPRFAARPFYEWAARQRLHRRARARQRRVLYFADTYVNYCDPELGQALVAILQDHGVSVYVPARQGGSGMPLVTAGDLPAARVLARRQVRQLAEAVRDGYEVVCTEPTAALWFKQDVLTLGDDADAATVAEHTSEACEYLRQMHATGQLGSPMVDIPVSVACHTPCHLKALGAGTPGRELLRLIPQLRVHTIERGCSGMAGTFGLKHENFRTSLRAGWPLLERLRDPDVDFGVTECSTCKMQMEQLPGKATLHPIKLLAHAYGLQPASELRRYGTQHRRRV